MRLVLRGGSGLAARKKIGKSQFKKKAWDEFSRYIRLKYSDRNGYCNCITCGKNMHWKEAQAGHGIPGRKNGILFLEEIVRPQCYACNIRRHGMQEVFVPYLIDTYGRDGYDSFLRLKHESVKFYASDYERMWNEYKKLADEYEAAIGRE